ncbi:hypothetical protein RchiOBHm_Chr7g0224791 [Rosa chinensis]|uniref:Uncharacterized protein n=1 Tax=Rosa chinensis TaxID=74649 RepID=A0A2P6PDX9_ROSCH|nr:hypothetical protein RchiOBHm_Chr7g0224791 [Rosa chinensis]
MKGFHHVVIFKLGGPNLSSFEVGPAACGLQSSRLWQRVVVRPATPGAVPHSVILSSSRQTFCTIFYPWGSNRWIILLFRRFDSRSVPETLQVIFVLKNMNLNVNSSWVSKNKDLLQMIFD